MDADGIGLRLARPARARPASGSRTSSRRCRAAGLDPEREPVPVAPAAHYLIGGVGSDLDGRTTPRRPARGRRVRLHRPARRQPARLELAQRVLRLRRPRRRARRSPSRRAGRPPAPPAWRFEPPTEATREAVWRCAGPRRDADGLERAARRPLPARPADRALGARAARVARRPPARRLPAPRPGARRRPPGGRSRTASVRAERWI